jgi:hypothetical protein
LEDLLASVPEGNVIYRLSLEWRLDAVLEELAAMNHVGQDDANLLFDMPTKARYYFMVIRQCASSVVKMLVRDPPRWVLPNILGLTADKAVFCRFH